MGLLNKLVSLMAPREDNAPTIKPERNEPCWCGSGKKYKKCHLLEDDRKMAAVKACNINCGPT